MNLNYNLRSGYFVVNTDFKYMIIGILLVANLIAINTYETAFAADNNTGALYGKGIALNGLHNYTGAITNFDKALAIDPNNKYALNGKGNALNGLHNYNEAITNFDTALAIDPNDKYALNGKVNALNGLHNYNEAITNF